MKRFLILIGLILLPAGAHAEALSPWVEEVIRRADQAMGVAAGLPVSTACDGPTAIAEIQNNLSAVRKAQTQFVKLEAEAASLRSRTVCYEYDRRLLQDKINQVLTAADSAVQACKFGTSQSLRSVYEFLSQAYASFLFGGANPAYRDDRLKYRYPFEDPSLIEPVYDSGSTMPVCAFTTDYSPHALGYMPTPTGSPAIIGSASFNIKSYGCDSTVLATISPPFDQEAGSLNTFMTESDDFARNTYNIVRLALFSLDQFISELSGGPITQLPEIAPAPPHEEMTGCLLPPIPDPVSSNPFEWEDLLLAYPEYFDPDKGRKDPATGIVSFGPTPQERLPNGVLFQPLVDYFRTMRATFTLSRSFIDRRTYAGLNRPLPQAFVNQTLDSYVSVVNRGVDSRQTLQYISANIEQQMAYLDAISRDAADGMSAAAEPLESAVDSLVEVVTEFLPNEYIPDLTYFLARSCVDGHCQQTLDAVARRTFNPYCHPYTSGDYMEDDAQKRCFCDPSIQGSWSEFRKYCSPDYSSDQGRYNALPPTLFPGCMEESAPRN